MGFYVQRRKAPGLNEGVLVANHALVYIFFLQAYVALGDTISTLSSKLVLEQLNA